VEKIFFGFGGRIEAQIKKASTYICTENGVPGTCFWKNIFGGEKAGASEKAVAGIAEART
jgi:hypothetical protein